MNEPTPPQIKRGLSLGSVVLMIGVALVVIVVGLQLAAQNLGQPTSGAAPLFEMTTFEDQPFRLEDQRGQIVVLNFWGSWCGPCRLEAPDLEALWQRYRDRGVVFVGVAYLDEEADSRAFLQEFNVTYRNGLDIGSRIADQYRIEGAPETFIIDREGNIHRFIYGPVNPETLSTTLDQMLVGAG